MRRLLLLLTLLPAPALAQQAVNASPPEALAVTVYRDPQRGSGALSLDQLDGFAMISETRTVDLPAGPATLRFEGVAEGMVGVSAIVTGLPGGVIEKNRNAALLSPAALVDGTLGNRVTLTRTNLATGAQVSQSAIIRTRADGGLVLQTSEGYEAVRCSGLPEKLQYDRVPDGLSAQPVFSINTNSKIAGRYRVTLSYLAAGFDWQAYYLATFQGDGGKDDARTRRLRLIAWLTLGNDNGQSFPDATLLAVAGKINVESDFSDLADSPSGAPLRLTCFASALPRPPMPAAVPMDEFGYGAEGIVVTARRRSESLQDIPVAIAMKAGEEALGDLKLYRVPEPITVAAKSLKQVAFLDRPGVRGKIVHFGACRPGEYDSDEDEPTPLAMMLRTRNDAAHGLGIALPAGKVAIFEPTSAGELLLGEEAIRDYASGQDIDLPLTTSGTAALSCGRVRSEKEDEEEEDIEDGRWHGMQARVTNANGHPIELILALADPATWQVRRTSGRASLRNGEHVLTATIPPGASRTLTWQLRYAENLEDAASDR